MKKAFLLLTFSLLLAVGWTSSAFAQPATYKAADMATWTYTWENAQGQTQTSNYVVWNAEKEAYETPEVHDAYRTSPVPGRAPIRPTESLVRTMSFTVAATMVGTSPVHILAAQLPPSGL